jgi:hypothetical protein
MRLCLTSVLVLLHPSNFIIQTFVCRREYIYLDCLGLNFLCQLGYQRTCVLVFS